MRKNIRLMGLLLLVSSCLVAAEDRSTSSLGSVDSVAELAAAFNESNGVSRLVLLLSPT